MTTKPTANQTLANKINTYRKSSVVEITKKYGKYCWGLYYGDHVRSQAVIVAYRKDKYSVPSWTEIKTMTASIDKTFKNKNEFIEWIKKESFIHRNNLNDYEKHRKLFKSCMEEIEIDAGDYAYRMNIKKQNRKN
jgi:hypothetical protein